MTYAPPAEVLVEVTRGDSVESRHYGSAVIADLAGLRWSVGDPAKQVFPRSATKLIQTLALVETGAADHFAVSQAELALACASHNGEPVHVDLAGNWLARLGLDQGALKCGTHWPMLDASARELAARGAQPSALHNNCSGKHAGFLATALHLRESVEDYVELKHPTQQRWLATLEDLADFSLAKAPMGIDGCSIPVPAMLLQKLAGAYARFAAPSVGSGVRMSAIDRITAAVATHPHLIAGEGRMCTRIIAATNGRVLVKVGAEGVYAGCIPGEGVGFSLKIADGAARAAEVAVVALVRRALGSAHPLLLALEPLRAQTVQTRIGRQVGIVRATASL